VIILAQWQTVLQSRCTSNYMYRNSGWV